MAYDTPPTPALDPTTLWWFVDNLAVDGGPVHFQLYSDTRDKTKARVLSMSSIYDEARKAELWEIFTQAQEDKVAVAVMVNGASSVDDTRTAANVVRYRALFCDVDYKKLPEGVTQEEAKATLLSLSPHVVVGSGGGLHAYWLLDSSEWTSVTEWLGHQAALAAACHGDPMVVTVDHVMRLVGTNNHKQPTPRPVILIHADVGLARYTPDTMPLDPLAIQAAKVQHHPLGWMPAKPSTVDRVKATVLANSWPRAVEGQGGDAELWRVAVFCAQNKIHHEATVEILEAYNEAKAVPPFSPREVAHKAERARLWILSTANPRRQQAQDVIDTVGLFAHIKDLPEAQQAEAEEFLLAKLAKELQVGGFDPVTVAQAVLQAMGMDDTLEEQTALVAELGPKFVAYQEAATEQTATEQQEAQDLHDALTEWREGLDFDTNKDGVETPSDYNLALYLEHSPLLAAVAVNRCSGDFRVGGEDITAATFPRWCVKAIRNVLGGPSFSIADIRNVTKTMEWPTFCPVREWLETLPPWDGVDYVSAFITKGLGIEADTLTRAKVEANLVGAVKRVMEPACKHDTVLTLAGPTGLRKSSMWRALFGEAWFIDNGVNPSAEGEGPHRTNAILLGTVWAAELAELADVRKGDEEKVKAYLTTQTDVIRTLYTQSPQKLPRRSVFVGTANLDKGALFRDPALARRFHILEISETLDTDLVAAMRPRLWAQVLALYRQGAPNFLPPELDAMERGHMATYMDDGVDSLLAAKVSAMFADKKYITAATLLANLGHDVVGPNARRVPQEVARQLKALGYVQGVERLPHGDTVRVWRAPASMVKL